MLASAYARAGALRANRNAARSTGGKVGTAAGSEIKQQSLA